MTPQNIHKNTPTLQAEIDLRQTKSFLSILAEGEKVTFQTFDDSKRKNPKLARVFHGNYDACVQELIKMNRQGAGVFITVNGTNLRGRTTADVIKIRGVFVDLDGAPLEPVMSALITPHVVVESSPGKYHAYWLLEGLALEHFTTVQKHLARMFGGDSQVCDLPRVMRLPGFLHKKQKPFMTHIISTSSEKPAKAEYFIEKFDINVNEGGSSQCQIDNYPDADFKNPILKALQDQNMIIERKKQPQGCIVIRCPWAHRHSTEDKGTCYYEPNTNGHAGHGFKCFHSHCATKTIAHLKEFLDVKGDPNGVFLTEPLPLNTELLAVAYFEEDMLPDVLRPWIVDCAERMQVPIDFLAASCVVVLGSLIGRKVGIYPKSQDVWLVIPNLWGAIIGRPSLLKSPAITEMMKPLDRLIADAIELHKVNLDMHAQQEAWQEAQKAAQKEELKKAAKGAGPKKMPDLPIIESTPAPMEKRYKTEDSTIEKIGEILKSNPQGILVHRDELVGWLKSLDRYGREGDRAFYLEAWDGNGSFTVDRIGRGTLHIPALCISILGGIQPGPLSSYINQATGGGCGDDGLLQRFQVTVWPDPPQNWKNVDRKPDKEAEENVNRLFRALDAFLPFLPCPDDPFKTQAFNFTPEAQKVFDDWRADLEKRLLSKEYSDTLASHFAKYRSLMPSLALIFYLVKTVGIDIDPVAVDEESAKLAIKWCEYLASHARRLYASAESTGMESARALLEKIRKGDLPDGFSPYTVYYGKHWSNLESAEKVNAAIKILEDFGWVITLTEKKDTGRPATKVYAHPSLGRKP